MFYGTPSKTVSLILDWEKYHEHKIVYISQKQAKLCINQAKTFLLLYFTVYRHFQILIKNNCAFFMHIMKKRIVMCSPKQGEKPIDLKIN